MQQPFLGYCPNYIVIEEVYRDLWGLEGGWLKRFCIAMGWRLYCKKWLDCIAAWGKNCIAGVALYCSLGVMAEIVLHRRGVDELCRNTLKCIVTEAVGLCRDTGSRHSRAGPRHSRLGAGALGWALDVGAPGCWRAGAGHAGARCKGAQALGTQHGGRWMRDLSAPCARHRPTGCALGALSLFLTQF